MDPIYNNCYSAVNSYTARVFNSTHDITQFNNTKAAVKVETVPETTIPAEKASENVAPAVDEVSKDTATAKVEETSAVAPTPVVKKKTIRKKNTTVAE